ncbi:DNA polymerase (family 10) [Lacibacter cauensis]|uniref:DNA polymerase beta n=1 Tax=Lacibacter cauensis TaxID=510947 RepID=A0A562SDT1_9BACT|nr:nucleotidyltransferase domain-containing protein [Lacibacter cauensis]TWI79283.1 DNA polymerase (family 10) [Lacibacter cauensis]
MLHPAHNLQLAAIFHSMADCYNYLGKEERFRALAYENAAKMLYNMPEDVAVYNNIAKLDELQGVGESIAEKILEFLQTGTIKTYEQLKKKVPFALLELMNITGFGPATLRTLHKQLHIGTLEELAEALQQNRLQHLKGFGSKKISNMLRALKLEKEDRQRLPLAEAEQIANKLVEQVRSIPGVQRAELAGSLRRRKETIGDIDLVITTDAKDRKKIVRKLIALPGIEKVIAAGTTKISIVLAPKHIQVDARIVRDDEFGAAMLYFTGSKEHNIQLRSIARERGLKINEYGIFTKQGKRVAGATEQEMYNYLGLHYIPPEQRVNQGEIERAKQLSNGATY